MNPFSNRQILFLFYSLTWARNNKNVFLVFICVLLELDIPELYTFVFILALCLFESHSSIFFTLNTYAIMLPICVEHCRNEVLYFMIHNNNFFIVWLIAFIFSLFFFIKKVEMNFEIENCLFKRNILVFLLIKFCEVMFRFDSIEVLPFESSDIKKWRNFKLKIVEIMPINHLRNYSSVLRFLSESSIEIPSIVILKLINRYWEKNSVRWF